MEGKLFTKGTRISSYQELKCERGLHLPLRDKLIAVVIPLPKRENITVLYVIPFVLHFLLNYFLPSYFCVPFFFRVTYDFNER